MNSFSSSIPMRMDQPPVQYTPRSQIILLLLIGPTGIGKETFAQYLQEQLEVIHDVDSYIFRDCAFAILYHQIKELFRHLRASEVQTSTTCVIVDIYLNSSERYALTKLAKIFLVHVCQVYFLFDAFELSIKYKVDRDSLIDYTNFLVQMTAYKKPVDTADEDCIEIPPGAAESDELILYITGRDFFPAAPIDSIYAYTWILSTNLIYRNFNQEILKKLYCTVPTRFQDNDDVQEVDTPRNILHYLHLNCLGNLMKSSYLNMDKNGIMPPNEIYNLVIRDILLLVYDSKYMRFPLLGQILSERQELVPLINKKKIFVPNAPIHHYRNLVRRPEGLLATLFKMLPKLPLDHNWIMKCFEQPKEEANMNQYLLPGMTDASFSNINDVPNEPTDLDHLETTFENGFSTQLNPSFVDTEMEELQTRLLRELQIGQEDDDDDDSFSPYCIPFDPPEVPERKTIRKITSQYKLQEKVAIYVPDQPLLLAPPEVIQGILPSQVLENEETPVYVPYNPYGSSQYLTYGSTISSGGSFRGHQGARDREILHMQNESMPAYVPYIPWNAPTPGPQCYVPYYPSDIHHYMNPDVPGVIEERVATELFEHQSGPQVVFQNENYDPEPVEVTVARQILDLKNRFPNLFEDQGAACHLCNVVPRPINNYIFEPPLVQIGPPQYYAGVHYTYAPPPPSYVVDTDRLRPVIRQFDIPNNYETGAYETTIIQEKCVEDTSINEGFVTNVIIPGQGGSEVDSVDKSLELETRKERIDLLKSKECIACKQHCPKPLYYDNFTKLSSENDGGPSEHCYSGHTTTDDNFDGTGSSISTMIFDRKDNIEEDEAIVADIAEEEGETSDVGQDVVAEDVKNNSEEMQASQIPSRTWKHPEHRSRMIRPSKKRNNKWYK